MSTVSTQGPTEFQAKVDHAAQDNPDLPGPFIADSLRSLAEPREASTPFVPRIGRMHNPPHPGALLQECLVGVSITQAAAQLGVTRAYLSRILHGRSAISADMALRLSDLLGTSAELWLGMQSAYDLWQASQKPRPLVARLAMV